MHSKTRITMNRRDATTAVAATAIGAVWSTETSAAADTNEEASKMDYDAIVVGGGPSGLSAALVLGRSCRKVLVCDAGQPRNRTSPAVHSFFSRDGIRPVELLKIGREQLKPYDVSFHDGRVTNAQRSNPGFRVQTESLDVEVFFIRAPVVPRSSLAKQLGCKLVSMTGVYSDTAETDQFGATSVPGVYVVGDASVGAPQVATAVTDGAMAATMINKSLVKDGVPSR